MPLAILMNMPRFAPYEEQAAAHDLGLEINNLMSTYRNKGRSVECVGQALMSAFFRLCAHEAKGDAEGARFLAQRIMDGTIVEYSISLEREKAEITRLYEERSTQGLSS